MNQTNNETKSNLGLWGWILFIFGILLMFNSLNDFLFYGPIFLISFIISIIQITRKHIGSGITLLVLTLVLPPLFLIGIYADNVNSSMIESKNKEKMELLEKKLNIEFEDVKVHSSGNYMYCEGKIRNTGSQILDFIKVKVEWLDINGTIIDTDYTYAISDEGLKPNEAKSFKIMTPYDRKMKSARYYIFE